MLTYLTKNLGKNLNYLTNTNQEPSWLLDKSDTHDSSAVWKKFQIRRYLFIRLEIRRVDNNSPPPSLIRGKFIIITLMFLKPHHNPYLYKTNKIMIVWLMLPDSSLIFRISWLTLFQPVLFSSKLTLFIKAWFFNILERMENQSPAITKLLKVERDKTKSELICYLYTWFMWIAYPMSTYINLVDTKPIDSQLAPVLQKVDNTIGFPNTFPLDSDLSNTWCYLPFEQLGPRSLASKYLHYQFFVCQIFGHRDTHKHCKGKKKQADYRLTLSAQ